MENALAIGCVVLGAVCILVGFVGCVVPAIPGPLVAFASLLCLLPTTNPPGMVPMIAAGVIMVGASVMDYVVPSISAKRFNCSKAGVIGCTIGSIVGMFFMPIGLFLGPFAGAIIGELLSGNKEWRIVNGGFGALLGVIAGMLIKMASCGIIAVVFAVAAVKCF